MAHKTFRPGAEGSLIVAVVEAVAECRDVPEEWVLYSDIDIEAVEQIVASTEDAEIRFPAAGCQVTVTGAGGVTAEQ